VGTEGLKGGLLFGASKEKVLSGRWEISPQNRHPGAVIVIVIVVAAVGVGSYFLLKGGEGEDIGEATSLDLKLDATYMGETLTMRFRVKNIGTPNVKIRIDYLYPIEVDPGFASVSILDVGENKKWDYRYDEWDVEDLDMEEYLELKEHLDRWVRGETNYTYDGATVRIYDIVVNPDLPDSLFQPSAPPQPPSYPAVAATSARYGDNTIRINVSTGSIPANEWAYSISTTEGSYTWITGTSELAAPYVSLGTYAYGTYFVSLKHIDSGHIYFWDQMITISYPAISAASAKHGDNEIRINVLTGSIPANEWAYSVSAIAGSYSWTTGTSELAAPYVSLGTYAAGTYYVSLKHFDSGHIYFWDQTITIS